MCLAPRKLPSLEFSWVFLGALSGDLSMDDADSIITGGTPGDEAMGYDRFVCVEAAP